MGTETIETVKTLLLSVSKILLAGTVAGKLANRCKIPDVVLFLLAGIFIGPSCLNLVNVPTESVLNQVMLILGAAFLLFQGGTEVRIQVLRSVWITVALLATVAVFVMVAVVGYTAHLILGIELIFALLLAAVLASTDPATLVPIFLSIKIKERVANTVISESAFNDATGAIVTVTILGLITTGTFSVSGSLYSFILMAGGGMLVGGLMGLLSGWLLCDKGQNLFAEYTQALTLPVIIISYVAAEHFSFSGFMAVFTAGLVWGNLGELGLVMREQHQEELHNFMDIGSLLLRMIIFILLGTHVDFAVVREYLMPGCVIVFVMMFAARPLAVLLCALPDRRTNWSKNEIVFMFWTRETGVIPAALSGMLCGMGVQHAEIIAAVTFIAILATLVIQASTTPWLAQRLNLLEK